MEKLPLDILLYIVDLLAGGDDDSEDINSLRILSQTCKSMVPLCRKHLFSSLRLSSELSFERFGNLLSENPDIAYYVKSLNYRVYNPIYDHEWSILDILKKRASLKSMTLSSPGLDWKDFPESIRLSLVFLIQLPTVADLNIEDFKGFPVTALSGCRNLIDLQLERLVLAHPEGDQVISCSKIPTPVSIYIGERTYGLAALLNTVDFSRPSKGDVRCGMPRWHGPD